MAFAHVDDVGAIPAALNPISTRPPARSARRLARRRVRGGDRCGGADLGREAMLGERADDPAGAIIGISGVGQVLELAPAAFGKVTAWRHLVARALDQRAVVER